MCARFLLRRIVNVNAKNLDGKTTMDMLQTYKSPLFPKISRLLNRANERLICSGPTMTLGEYLSKKPSFFQKRNSFLGLANLSKIRHTSLDTSDNRSVILVVAILIDTATYQAGFSPPGGFWQEDSKPGDSTNHIAGEMTMTIGAASFFYVFNGVAFFSSLYVIMILITGLPMWIVLYGSTAALGIANFACSAEHSHIRTAYLGILQRKLCP
ncbi:PREDICTED: uncharacterized protein LOC104718644 [Camelina sativa]|uniref:Uncharacterized protein LOC104718644 n=1 Tax=Camelina sativa TaxID=90675 RepID=A0ABM0U262_CAMSA|nr:PREDICTED: uncharacterized protein LOC104718644 [Camelina sativa]